MNKLRLFLFLSPFIFGIGAMVYLGMQPPETPEEKAAREQLIADREAEKLLEMQNEFEASYNPNLGAEKIDFLEMALAWERATDFQYRANKTKYEGKYVLIEGYVNEIIRSGYDVNKYEYDDYRVQVLPQETYRYPELGLLDTFFNANGTCMVADDTDNYDSREALVDLAVNDYLTIVGKIKNYGKAGGLKLEDCFIVEIGIGDWRDDFYFENRAKLK